MRTPDSFYESSRKRLRAAIRYALHRIGREIVEALREVISEPVTRLSAHKSDIIRSEPGEPPFKEFGVLWKSITKKVNPGAASLDDLSVYTALKRALWLELGTKRMEARPFWNSTWARIKPLMMGKFREYVAEYLRSKAQDDSDFDVDV